MFPRGFPIALRLSRSVIERARVLAVKSMAIYASLMRWCSRYIESSTAVISRGSDQRTMKGGG